MKKYVEYTKEDMRGMNLTNLVTELFARCIIEQDIRIIIETEDEDIYYMVDINNMAMENEEMEKENITYITCSQNGEPEPDTFEGYVDAIMEVVFILENRNTTKIYTESY